MNSYDQLTAVKFMGSIGFQHIELVLVCHNEVKVSIIMNIFGLKPDDFGGGTLSRNDVVGKCCNDIILCAI